MSKFENEVEDGLTEKAFSLWINKNLNNLNLANDQELMDKELTDNIYPPAENE